MLAEVISGAAALTAGTLAWAVRGKSSTLLGPSIWRGPRTRKLLALTFDDGPSEGTPEVLSLLARFGVRATFFQCGHAVRRLPEVAREVLSAGHEIGNHTDTHAALFLRSPGFIYSELEFAQRTIEQTVQVSPLYFRPPFGARWFGLRAAQERLDLQCVMWTTIARDWVLGRDGIVNRLRTGTEPGAILCLHDGRELNPNPDVAATVGALKKLIPYWRDTGYEFATLTDLLCRPESSSA